MFQSSSMCGIVVCSSMRTVSCWFVGFHLSFGFFSKSYESNSHILARDFIVISTPFPPERNTISALLYVTPLRPQFTKPRSLLRQSVSEQPTELTPIQFPP